MANKDTDRMSPGQQGDATPDEEKIRGGIDEIEDEEFEETDDLDDEEEETEGEGSF